ncbi:MAG: AEC family transporter [Solobacterium sp.]|nr:AEC family transporter [Solobacterium sp.]
MNSILIAANAVLPVAFMMLLGTALKSRGIIKDSSFRDFNWIVFHICLPVSLFNSIQSMDTAMLTEPRIVLFAYSVLAVIVILPMILLGRTTIDDRQKGVMVQAIFRSNFVILGLPIVESIYGAGNIGAVPLLIAFVVPAFNIVSVIVLQHYSGTKGNPVKTIKGILTNPLIIATILGFLYKFSGIHTPDILASVLNQLVRMSTPLSLLVLGGSFQLVSVRGNRKLLGIVAAGRLIAAPLIALTTAAALGYRGADLAGLMVLFGGPAAIASFSMAMQMGLDSELAAQCVMVTTIGVIFTMFGWITVLSSLGLL